MARKRLFKPDSEEEETILGVRITKEKRHLLKLLAAKKRTSMAELVREIVDTYLNKIKKEIKAIDKE